MLLTMAFPLLLGGFMLLSEEVPALLIHSWKDLAQIRSGELSEETVWLSSKTWTERLPGPYSSGQPEPVIRYGATGMEPGSGWGETLYPGKSGLPGPTRKPSIKKARASAGMRSMPRNTGCGLPTISGWWFWWSRWRNRRQHPPIKSKSTQEESHSCALFSCVFGRHWLCRKCCPGQGAAGSGSRPPARCFPPSRASVGCDGSLYNGKSQPGTAALPAAGAVAPEEGFPEMGEILSGDGKPIIADRKADPAGFPGQGKANLTASRAVAQGVGEEIPTTSRSRSRSPVSGSSGRSARSGGSASAPAGAPAAPVPPGSAPANSSGSGAEADPDSSRENSAAAPPALPCGHIPPARCRGTAPAFRGECPPGGLRHGCAEQPAGFSAHAPQPG